MRNHIQWLFIIVIAAFVGCTDDVIINNPAISDNAMNKPDQSLNNLTTDDALPALIGGKIWVDLNKNGIQDDGEAGLPNVTVALYTCENQWLSIVKETDANGEYSFLNPPILPGKYRVRMNIPDGYSLSPLNVGSNDEIDSDFDPASDNTNRPYTECFDIVENTNDLTWDGGVYPIPQITGQVGNRIWKDMNKNGIQDVGESGFPGVTVALYGCDGAWLNIVMNTNADGIYLFKNINPGKYKVKINLPDGWTFSPKNIGSDDSRDSDFGSDNFTDCFDLTSGEINLTVDGGLYPANQVVNTGKLGNLVWKDINKNGIQDWGEPGIYGVKIELYNCSDLTAKIKETTTNLMGKYLFTDLPAGDYKIKFIAPTGYKFTLKDEGSNDSKDSDADPTSGFTDCINLAAAGSSLNNDAGMYYEKLLYPRSYGYWKTHSKYGPAHYDPNWALVGEETIFFHSGQSWYEVINSNPRKGNAYYILAHQYIAAVLNELAGAPVNDEIVKTMAKAKSLFDDSANTPFSIGKLRGNNPLRKEFIKLASLLEKFNYRRLFLNLIGDD